MENTVGPSRFRLVPTFNAGPRKSQRQFWRLEELTANTNIAGVHQMRLLHRHSLYRVVKKKVSFGIFSIIKTTYDIDFFTVKTTDKILSLSKF